MADIYEHFKHFIPKPFFISDYVPNLICDRFLYILENLEKSWKILKNLDKLYLKKKQVFLFQHRHEVMFQPDSDYCITLS